MNEIFEAAMVICFGASWPLNLYKSVKSKTAKGKSLLFEILIATGYVCGIVGKIYSFTVLGAPVTYPFIFYILNLVMVTADILLTLRNRKLDKAAEKGE